MASHLLRNPKRSSLLLTLSFFPRFKVFYSHFSGLCRRKPPPFSPPRDPPPVPKRVPFAVSAHGTSWQDPFHWMSNTTDPDFSRYLHHENSFAEAFMADTLGLQRTLFAEMNSRMPTTISTPTERWGPWLYYQYVPVGKEYPVFCRKLATQTNGWTTSFLNKIRGEIGREKILLDWNEIAEEYGYVHVGTCQVSPDHNFLAYTLDITGSERFMLQIKDLQSGCILPDSKVHGVVSLAWAQDSCTLFYTTTDENQRPYRVLCRKLFSDAVNDVQVFTESDPSFCVDITSTKDGKFITVNSNSRSSSEEGTQVFVINPTNPEVGLRRMNKRVNGVRLFLEHHSGFFYVLTNAPLNDKELYGGAYYLARCQVDDFQLANWQNVILPSEDISIQDMDIFHGHLVLFLNKKGCSMICSINMPIDLNSKQQKEIGDLNPWFFPLPSDLCNVVPCSNHDFMNFIYRVVVSSPVMPDVIIDYDVRQRVSSVVQQEEVLGVSGNTESFSGTHDPNKNILLDAQNDENRQALKVERWKDFSDAYCCERKEVISHDGIEVPLTILYSREAWKKGLSPGLLYGYGAYGEVLNKNWCSDRLSLLDCGWVVAFADVRGGGGPDPSWHKQGSGLNKLNSIYDFVLCGKYLVNEGYVHEDQLGAIGISAGGLLVGAAINMCPDLFRAAILKVPFLDICNTLLDPNLPLTLMDYEEFGNPQVRSQFESILSYSPYNNIPQGSCHPAVLVTASFHDTRVGVWEAAKWVAKVRDSTCSRCSGQVILKTNMNGGHFGEGGRHGRCEETAYDYAFLIKAMGISWDSR